MAQVSPDRELGTQSSGSLTVGAYYGDYGDVLWAYDGRIACLKIYNTAFTDDEAIAATKNWECPHGPGKSLAWVWVRFPTLGLSGFSKRATSKLMESGDPAFFLMGRGPAKIYTRVFQFGNTCWECGVAM